MRRAALSLVLPLVVVVVGCGSGGDNGQNPPPNITLDAYVAHNQAVEVQERWESDDPEVGGLCSRFYRSPKLAEDLQHPNSIAAIDLTSEYRSLLLGVSRAEMTAADACAEGTELQPWQSDELDKELSARGQQQAAEEEQIAETAARVIGRVPQACSSIHRDAGPLGKRRNLDKFFRTKSAYEEGIRRGLEDVRRETDLIPEDVDLDDVAERFVLSCATTSPPQQAAASLRHANKPTDELRNGTQP